CNIPGFVDISGLELAEKWKNQVESLGAKVLLKEVGKIEIAVNTQTLSNLSSALPVKTDTNIAPRFSIQINEQEIYYAKTLIVATGSERRRLNIPGEKGYLGKGVSYCTTCDAAFFRNKTAIIVGGSDAAITGAIHLADYCQKVYIIYRGDKLRAEPVWLEDWKKIEASGKGITIYKTNLIEILGKNSKVTGVKLDQGYQGNQKLQTDGIFIAIGGVPGTSLIQSLGVKLDDSGHVVVNDEMETNIAGLFCAGDMTDKSKILKQAITAMAQGAISAASVYKFIKKENAPAQRGI
ncbi:MAG: FAD-dependent oxidoreductase, partial [Candidatus Methanoperedens sp.]|nr:FAD-dependent oxidoreductase [Candidatus Methanoperedens sp.]